MSRKKWWITCIIASVIQILVWFQIWVPYYIAVHHPKEPKIAVNLGPIVGLIVSYMATLISPIVWFSVYIVFRYFIFFDPAVKLRHAVFLIIAVFPLLLVGAFVFRWPY